MFELWLELSNLPVEGVSYSLNNQKIWQQPIDDFELPYEIVGSISADVHIQPQTEGFFINGLIVGKMILPCSRCAEPTEFDLNESFKVFESTISLDQEHIPESNEETYLRKVSGNIELDIAGILWEQFVLAIPMKPVCSERCLGLCPYCGQNLNFGPCECQYFQGDSRMAVFRNIKVVK